MKKLNIFKEQMLQDPSKMKNGRDNHKIEKCQLNLKWLALLLIKLSMQFRSRKVNLNACVCKILS